MLPGPSWATGSRGLRHGPAPRRFRRGSRGAFVLRAFGDQGLACAEGTNLEAQGQVSTLVIGHVGHQLRPQEGFDHVGLSGHEEG